MAFATILAVVAGLTLSGASAVSHDIYASVIKKGKAVEADEIRVSKMTTIALGVLAMFLGIAFEKQNIAFMVGLAFSIAASANFPVLFLSMFWKGEWVNADTVICELEGNTRALLTGERSALNFLQTLSAVATVTRDYASVIAGTAAVVHDTRKTLPGLRRAQKYAVTVGGGANQRENLRVMLCTPALRSASLITPCSIRRWVKPAKRAGDS